MIQWHVLGMFIPSFFTGRLIDRHGAAVVALGGVAAFAASGIVATIGTGFFYFLISSCLLGIGWNFTYLAGTTQITASHRPEERGRVQGTAEVIIASVGAGASFAAGGLLTGGRGERGHPAPDRRRRRHEPGAPATPAKHRAARARLSVVQLTPRTRHCRQPGGGRS